MKIANLISFGLSLMLISSASFAEELIGANSLKTKQEFQAAVDEKKVFLTFSEDIPMDIAGDGYARKPFEIKLTDSSSSIINIKCSFMIETSLLKITLGKTEKDSSGKIEKKNSWKVEKTMTIGESMTRWTLTKENAPDLNLTCTSQQRKGDEMIRVALEQQHIYKALSVLKSDVVTSFKASASETESPIPASSNSTQ